MLELKTPSPRRRLVHNRHGAPGQVKGATHERSELALDRPSTVALFEATKRGVIAHKKTTFFWTINTVATSSPRLPRAISPNNLITSFSGLTVLPLMNRFIDLNAEFFHTVPQRAGIHCQKFSGPALAMNLAVGNREDGPDVI